MGMYACRSRSYNFERIEGSIRIPRLAMLIFTGHDPRWSKYGSCGNILQQSYICVTKPARDWFHEIFFQAIACEDCLTGKFLPWLFWARFCRFVFAFVFNFRPVSTNGLILPSRFVLPAINFSYSQSLALSISKFESFFRFKVFLHFCTQKDKDFCVFPLSTWNRCTVSF